MARPVNVRLKLDSFIRHLAKLCETEYLKASAIGEDHLLPRYEAMQSAELIDDLMTGPQIKMICVAENDSRSCLFKHLLGERLNGALSSDWHKRWRIE